MDDAQKLIDALIETQGTLYSEEMGANIARDTPVELFHWLIGAIMLSARISSHLAVRGAAALRAEGLHKADAIRAAERARLVRVLNENGYARYDETTADHLKATADWLHDTCRGDLRRLRDAGGSATAVLNRLTGTRGLGPAGARIFAREAQCAWDVFYPRLDGPGARAAADLGLPKGAGTLAEMAGGRMRFVRLAAGLTRAALDGPSDAVRAAAG